eukprot:scaffold275853_cov17-Prasinocladus_malaysianus.AAC.1
MQAQPVCRPRAQQSLPLEVSIAGCVDMILNGCPIQVQSPGAERSKRGRRGLLKVCGLPGLCVAYKLQLTAFRCRPKPLCTLLCHVMSQF